MTLEEAIKHEEEIVKEEQYEYQECVATHNTEGAMNCRKYAEEHRQLAEWLKDYKRLLEQQPCEDAINREDTLEAMIEQLGIRSEDYLIPAERTLYKVVQNMPPVTPQPKIGHWIDDKCSACGKGIEDLIDSREWYRNEKPNFCPFCGLRLVDSQESEE